MACADVTSEDLQLFQLIEEDFVPAQGWQDAPEPMTTEQFLFNIEKLHPGKFDTERLEEILHKMHFRQELNEHNGITYWLVKRVV